LHSVEGNKHPTKVFNQIKHALNKGLDTKGLPVPEIDVQEPPSPKPTITVTSPTASSSSPSSSKSVTIVAPTPKHEPEDFRMSKAEVTRALRRYTQQATSGADVMDRTMELFWEQADPDGTGHVSAADIFEWVKRGIRIPVLRGKSAEEVEIMLEQDVHGGEITKDDFFKSLRDWSSGKRRPETEEGSGGGENATPRDSTTPGEGDGGETVQEHKTATAHHVEAEAEAEAEEAGAGAEAEVEVEVGSGAEEDAPPPSSEDGVPVEEGDAPPPAEPDGEGGGGSGEGGEEERGSVSPPGDGEEAPPGDEDAPGE